MSRLSKDQVSAIASSLNADIEELYARPLDGSPVSYVWLDVTAIGCNAVGWRCVLGVSTWLTMDWQHLFG